MNSLRASQNALAPNSATSQFGSEECWPNAHSGELNAILHNLGLLQQAPLPLPVPTGAYSDRQLSRLAKALWSIRRIRTQSLGSAIFGEPAWDIMLDLYCRQVRHEPVYVKGACLSADAPTTTALRWIDILAQKGWIARSADQADRRRQTILLTLSGFAKMRECLEIIAQVLNECRLDEPENPAEFFAVRG